MIILENLTDYFGPPMSFLTVEGNGALSKCRVAPDFRFPAAGIPTARLLPHAAPANALRCLDFLLALKDEDSLLSHGASLVISSMGSCC